MTDKSATNPEEMLFDADAFEASLKRPVIVLGGERIVGRPISFVAMAPLAKRFLQLQGAVTQGGEVDLGTMNDLVHEVCTEMGLPAERIMKLATGTVFKMLDAFFSESLAALGMPSLQLAPAGPPPSSSSAGGSSSASPPPGGASSPAREGAAARP